MKYFIVIFTASIFCLSSCGGDGNSGTDVNGKSSSKFSKRIDLPINTCDFITKEMVLSHFDVKTGELDLKDNNDKKSSTYSRCGYQWKKSNYEEIQKKKFEIIRNYSSAGKKADGGNEKKAGLSDLMNLESPNSKLLIGDFKDFENNEEASKAFKRSHHVPSKEDVKKLHKEIDKKGEEEGLDEESKELGKNLTGSIASNLKFTEINGVGDEAYYDHLDKSLDVRFGTLTFSVYIDSENDFKTNMEIAKKIAKEVWEKL